MKWADMQAGDMILADWEDGDRTLEIFVDKVEENGLDATGWSVLEIWVKSDGTCVTTPDLASYKDPEHSPLVGLDGITRQVLMRDGRILKEAFRVNNVSA
jgi:hypothetical protein